VILVRWRRLRSGRLMGGFVDKIERVMLDLLEPFGFDISTGFIMSGDRGKAVIVVGCVIKLHRWDHGTNKWKEDWVVDLCDPGSFGAIEGWAG